LKRVRWEGPEPLAAGKHTLEFVFKYDGMGPATLAFNNMSGIGQSGTGVLKIDGKEVATQKMEHTIPLILQWDETFDVGSDTGTSVDDKDYQVPFAFNGKLAKLTIKLIGRSSRRKTRRSSWTQGETIGRASSLCGPLC
jgi:arylsulfatase